MKTALSAILILLLCGCVAHYEETEKYAVLREAPGGRVQVSIESTSSTAFPTATVEGFASARRNLYYWATLSGSGPDYVNPTLQTNSPYMQPTHTGVISIDRAKGIVIIKLDQIVPKVADHGPNLGPNLNAKDGPSPANGSYRIKKTSRDAFITPE
jgi:hypothetical protein